MNGGGKSDKTIVPLKGANKERGRPRWAECLEGRGLAKGNSEEHTGFWTQCQIDLNHALDWIREAAGRDKDETSVLILTRQSLKTSLPEAGARCGNSARRDLCGGWPERAIPTATGMDEMDRRVRAHLSIRSILSTMVSGAFKIVVALVHGL